MKTYRLAAFAAVLCAVAAGPGALPAFSQAVVNVADPTVSSQRVQVTSSGEAKVSCTTGCSAASALAVGTNGATAPTSSMQVGTKDGSGNLQPASAANPVPISGTVSVIAASSGNFDPCTNSTKSYADFESTTSGGSIITAVTAKKAYLCAISIITSTAANVSLDEGTGSSVCTGGTPAAIFLNTGVTAANGAALAANGGIQAGNGSGTVAANGTANYNICVVFTTTNTPQVNVHVSYVQQ